MAYAYYNNSGGVSYYPRYGSTSSSSTSNAARTAALAGLLAASSFVPGGAIVTYPTTVALSNLSSVNPASGFTGSTGSSSTKSSSTGSTKLASSVYTPTKTTTPTYTSTPTPVSTGSTPSTTANSGTGSSTTGGTSSSSSTTNTPPPAPQSILNTTITVPQGKAPSLNSTPANASGTGSSSTAGTSLPSFAKSAAGFASRESPSFVSGVPSVDQLYSVYEQTFGKPQNPEAVRQYLGSEDFQSVLGGTVPMWMSSNPTWKLYLQRLGYNTGSNNARTRALQNLLNQ